MPLACGGSARPHKTDAGNNHEILIIYYPFSCVWVIDVPWARPEAAGCSASQSYEGDHLWFVGSLCSHRIPPQCWGSQPPNPWEKPQLHSLKQWLFQDSPLSNFPTEEVFLP